MHRRMLLAATGSAVLGEAEPEPLRIRAIASANAGPVGLESMPRMTAGSDLPERSRRRS